MEKVDRVRKSEKIESFVEMNPEVTLSLWCVAGLRGSCGGGNKGWMHWNVRPPTARPHPTWAKGCILFVTTSRHCLRNVVSTSFFEKEKLSNRPALPPAHHNGSMTSLPIFLTKVAPALLPSFKGFLPGIRHKAFDDPRASTSFFLRDVAPSPMPETQIRLSSGLIYIRKTEK